MCVANVGFVSRTGRGPVRRWIWVLLSFRKSRHEAYLDTLVLDDSIFLTEYEWVLVDVVVRYFAVSF